MKLNLEKLVRKGGEKSPPSVLLVVVWMIVLVWYLLSGFTIFGWKVPPIEPVSTLSALTLVAAYYVGKYNFYDPMRKRSEEEAFRPMPEKAKPDKPTSVKASPATPTLGGASPDGSVPTGKSSGRPTPDGASPDRALSDVSSATAPASEGTPAPGAPKTPGN